MSELIIDQQAADVSHVEPDQQLIVDSGRDMSLRLGEFRMATYAEVLNKASEVATQLSSIIKARKLFVKIGQKDHVYVDGWTTCGAMLGVVCRPLSCEETKDGEFVAVVEAVRASDGFVLGRGIASCGPDDRDWKSRTRQARRSMAQTRAAGKAMRLLFSWVMELAGYATTPFEEMDREPFENPTADPNAPTATPRAQRNTPAAITTDQCGALLDFWREKYPDTHDGDVKAWNHEFATWVRGTTRRSFAPMNSRDWTPDDFHKCCRALNYQPEDA